jgi:sugar phosphate isomerase/epimerase
MPDPIESDFSYDFSVSEFTTQPWTFEEDVAHYSRLGVAWLELCEAKLDDDDTQLQHQLQLLAQHHLRVSSVQPAVRTLYPSQSQPDPVPIPERMARFRRTIQRLESVAGGAPYVTNTGIPPNGNIQTLLDTAVHEYQALADFARDHGARIALEPLNPTILNIETAIWTLDQGMRLVEAVDRPNFGICLDFWNLWQSPGIADSIRACGAAGRIFIAQASDWRTPRSYQDRLIPGQGAIPLATLLRATHASGYRGPYEVEIFSGDVPDSLWSGDLDKLIADCRAGLDHAWRDALTP